MRVHYLGNFEPQHSTETHVALALEYNGVEVIRLQENNPTSWDLASKLHTSDTDFVLWTRTNWDNITRRSQIRTVNQLKEHGVLIVGYHLDRWWGLNREREILDRYPFFQADILCTADGGHEQNWKDAGIEHYWFPPGVSRAEAVKQGNVREMFRSPVTFVGNWNGSYHHEWTHRFELIDFLRNTYGDDLKLWPRPGEHAVRNDDLVDLYTSTSVVVGDSCLVGGATHYWSDRIPETLGRGGFLIHPYVEGLEDHYTDGEHLVTWELGNWDQLKELVQSSLENPGLRTQIAEQGREHVLETATYEVRMAQLLKLLEGRL